MTSRTIAIADPPSSASPAAVPATRSGSRGRSANLPFQQALAGASRSRSNPRASETNPRPDARSASAQKSGHKERAQASKADAGEKARTARTDIDPANREQSSDAAATGSDTEQPVPTDEADLSTAIDEDAGNIADENPEEASEAKDEHQNAFVLPSIIVEAPNPAIDAADAEPAGGLEAIEGDLSAAPAGVFTGSLDLDDSADGAAGSEEGDGTEAGAIPLALDGAADGDALLADAVLAPEAATKQPRAELPRAEPPIAKARAGAGHDGVERNDSEGAYAEATDKAPQFADELALAVDGESFSAPKTTADSDTAPAASFSLPEDAGVPAPAPATATSGGKGVDQTASLPTESRFAAVNHPRVVDVVRTQLLPTGGTMEIRLDPPELGAMQVRIEVKDGVVTASFQTSNDQATRLLSHTLEQLRQSLETRGVTVDKLQVQQLPKNEAQQGGSDGRQPQGDPQTAHHQQQEQQRREMLERMWRRIAIGRDEFDAVA